jgi:hypothetical protein
MWQIFTVTTFAFNLGKGDDRQALKCFHCTTLTAAIFLGQKSLNGINETIHKIYSREIFLVLPDFWVFLRLRK